MSTAKSGPRLKPRHVPQRTCIACRSTEAKRGLVRIVRTPEGRVELDPTGKKNGRGAYVHESRECWDAALKRDRLAHALKLVVPEEDLRRLSEHAEELPHPPAPSPRSGEGEVVSG